MSKETISYEKSGCFSRLITDYLATTTTTKKLYNRFPTVENFAHQIIEKQKNYTFNRSTLVSEITKQYQTIPTSVTTQKNIQSLLNTTTFTVTTGHQLNLFTGPLYFWYKIISTINLTSSLKEKYPDYNFVPVYWMATEDHDFEEINYFRFKNKTITWNETTQKGAVGNFSTETITSIIDTITTLFCTGKKAKELQELFKKAYTKHHNLALATRFLVNELFSDYGLVILDGNSKEFKKAFIPYAKTELTKQQAYEEITKTSELLKAQKYTVQVNPREINLFYIDKGLRERIIYKNNRYQIANTSINYTKEEMMELVETQPEKISPNVVLRPLYQEVILPNLCYIGGGGEIAYWLQLYSYFTSEKVSFPMLLLRNSAIIYTEKQKKKKEKLGLSWRDLFLKPNDLITKKTKELSKLTIDFSEQKQILDVQFSNLEALAKKTDSSFTGAVLAQKRKQIKGLEHLEKRLLKAEKRVLKSKIEQIENLQKELFPNGNLQERVQNFSSFYIATTSNFGSKIKDELHPLVPEFSFICIK